MKKADLKKDVEQLERRDSELKVRSGFLETIARVTWVLGTALLIVFVGYLLFTHYLIMGILSVVLARLEMPATAILMNNMGTQYFGLFLLAIAGLALMLVSKLARSKKNG